MSFKNIFAFIIFLVCSLKLCASEFYFHVIFNYSGSEKITILQREPDGSIGYFGDIARDNTRYYLSREEDVTSHNYDYMLSYDPKEMCFKTHNDVIGKISGQDNVYDLNNEQVMAGFLWDSLGYNFVNNKSTSLGRLEFCSGFAKVKIYESVSEQKLAVLLLMAAKKILSTK